jgi:hypothetical protein
VMRARDVVDAITLDKRLAEYIVSLGVRDARAEEGRARRPRAPHPIRRVAARDDLARAVLAARTRSCTAGPTSRRRTSRRSRSKCCATASPDVRSRSRRAHVRTRWCNASWRRCPVP